MCRSRTRRTQPNADSEQWVSTELLSDRAFGSVPDKSLSRLLCISVAYVIDKALSCSGIAQLTEYAARFTSHRVSQTVDFLLASGWDLHNLTTADKDIGPAVTLLVPTNDALQGFFNAEDLMRLATSPVFQPHVRDLLRHWMAPNEFSAPGLKTLSKALDGTYNLTMMSGEKVPIFYDQSVDKLSIGNGDGAVLVSDVTGIDGYVLT